MTTLRPFATRTQTFHPAIQKVIFKALAKDPKDRYPNIKAFAEALEQASLHTASWWLSSLVSQTTLSQIIEKIPSWTTSTGTVTTRMRPIFESIHRIAQPYLFAKELKQIIHIDALPGDDPYFEKRYPASPIHGKSGIYSSNMPLNSCVVDSAQMLLHDQGIVSIKDEQVAKEVKYGKVETSIKIGAYEKLMPDALKKFGSISYKWTPREKIEYLENALKTAYSIASSIKARSGYKKGPHVVVIDKIGEDSRGEGPFVYIRDSRHHEPYKVTRDAWEQAWIDGNVIPDDH